MSLNGKPDREQLLAGMVAIVVTANLVDGVTLLLVPMHRYQAFPTTAAMLTI
jgi:hypothetical protein